MDNKALEALGTMYLRLVTFDPDNAVYWTKKMAVISDVLYNAPASNNWQPIETAPKDGTTIFGWCDKWVEPSTCWWSSFAAKWSTVSSPTHWMPLPKPPTEE